MIKIPRFELYGENDQAVLESIQPQLQLRRWSDVPAEERKTALRELVNRGWLDDSHQALAAIGFLNRRFLRACPGKQLHETKPETDADGRLRNAATRINAATHDFISIWRNDKNDALFSTMISKFAEAHIDSLEYQLAEESETEAKAEQHISAAFGRFDRLSNCLNHIFKQFSVDLLLTRSGLVPRQDDKITKLVYHPVLRTLANPRWRSVSEDLSLAFDDYNNGRYSEAITKSHTAVHRFLQVLVGEEGKCGKGEVGKLFSKAKQEGYIPINRFIEGTLNALMSYAASERASKSTAKPSANEATASDALLMMNVVMVFLQHSLQTEK